MTYAKLKQILARAESMGVNDETGVYIDVYECLAFDIQDKEVVVDVNGNEVFVRKLRPHERR